MQKPSLFTPAHIGVAKMGLLRCPHSRQLLPLSDTAAGNGYCCPRLEDATADATRRFPRSKLGDYVIDLMARTSWYAGR
jgi:hypothetical protein